MYIFENLQSQLTDSDFHYCISIFGFIFLEVFKASENQLL